MLVQLDQSRRMVAAQHRIGRHWRLERTARMNIQKYARHDDTETTEASVRGPWSSAANPATPEKIMHHQSLGSNSSTWTKEPGRFIPDPIHQMPELNS